MISVVIVDVGIPHQTWFADKHLRQPNLVDFRILLRDEDHELIQREPPVFRAAVICNKPRALDGVGKPVVEVPPATTTIRQIIYYIICGKVRPAQCGSVEQHTMS